jgi:hypothetical protein
MNAESYQVLARSTIAKQNYFQNQPHITISLNADIQVGAFNHPHHSLRIINLEQ